MRYILMIKATPRFEAGIWPTEDTLAKMAEWHGALVAAGGNPACERLQPSSQGARVRYANGQTSVTDGPFAETKELIAGFAIIQADSLVAAVEWAKRTPFQEGEIEIRPVMELEDIPVDPAEQPDGWRDREEEFRAASPPARRPGAQRYLGLLKADPDTEAGKMPDEKALAAMGAFMEEGIQAGVFLGGEGLMPSSKGVRIQFNGNQRTVTDGPFAETKELIAGYAIFQFTSRAEAIAWTKHFVQVDAPCRYRGQCECEIRPIFELEQFGEKITEQFVTAGAR